MKLKIFDQNKHLENLTPFQIMATDVTVLNGIIKGKPKYEKGKKINAGYYLDKAQTNLAIQKEFEDVLDDNGFLTGINITIKWFSTFENPVLVKDIYVPFSISESAETITKRRKRAINFLQEAGVRLGVKPYIDMLFNYYSYYPAETTKNLINGFVENGSEELQQAIENETNPDITAILNSQLPNGDTVKVSFLYQIS